MSGISASWRRFTGIGRRVCHTCSDIMDNSFSYKIVFTGYNYPGVFFFTDVTFLGTATGTNFLHFLTLMSACYQVVSSLLLPISDNAWRTPLFLYLSRFWLQDRLQRSTVGVNAQPLRLNKHLGFWLYQCFLPKQVSRYCEVYPSWASSLECGLNDQITGGEQEKRSWKWDFLRGETLLISGRSLSQGRT